MKRVGNSERPSQQNPWLPFSDGDTRFHILLCPRQINNILNSVSNRTKTTRCHHKFHIITCRGPLHRSSDTSSTAMPESHYHWCQSDGHICQITHLPPTIKCFQNTRQIKGDKLSPYLPVSKATLHITHCLSRCVTGEWGDYSPKKDSSLPVE